MTDVFSNVPGVRLTFKDGGLAVNPPAPGTKVTVLAVTTSSSLDVNEPVVTAKQSDALALSYHADGSPSEMTHAISEAYAGGARIVELVKICREDASGNPLASGEVATESGGTYTKSDDMTADQRYDLLEDAYAQLLDHDVDIVVPYNVFIDNPGTASGSLPRREFGWQLAHFCYESTRGNNTAIGVIAHRSELEVADQEHSETVDVMHGTPTLAQLSRWATELKNHTYDSWYDGDGVNGTDGNHRPTSYAYFLNASDSTLPGTISSAETDANGWPIDLGKYISVVAGNVRHPNFIAQVNYPEFGYYNGNKACYYAGMLTRLPSEISPTNKALSGISVARKLSITQLNNCIGARYIVPRIKAGRGLLVADAMTGAWNVSRYYRSDYTRITTVQISHEVGDIIRNTIDPLIGNPPNPNTTASIQAMLDNLLQDMIEDGKLLAGSSAVFSQTPEERALNEGTVNASLQVPGELRIVTGVIGLSKATA